MPATLVTQSASAGVGDNSFSFTTSGESRLLLIAVSYIVGPTPQGDSLNAPVISGSSVQALGTVGASGNVVTDLYYVVEPPESGNIAITTTGGTLFRYAVAWAALSNVQLIAPTLASADGTGTTATGSVASRSGDLTLDVLAAAAPVTVTPDGSQAQAWSLQTSGTFRVRSAGSTKPGAPSVTFTWTLGTSVDWALGMLNFRSYDYYVREPAHIGAPAHIGEPAHVAEPPRRYAP